MNVSDKSGLPERYYCAQMSANGFTVIEQKPVLGRDFTAEDERPGAESVVMLTYHVWQDRYGRDPSIIGKAIRLNEIDQIHLDLREPLMTEHNNRENEC